MPDINKAYSWAITTCNSQNIGYSQSYRNQQVINGVTYYDCSSFINYALVAGGWSTPQYAPNNNAFWTSIEQSVLKDLGFTEYETNESFEWKAGDIGWRSGHTEMCYTGGTGTALFMGAHTDEYALEDQVSISSSPTSFTYCYRWGEGGAEDTGTSMYVISAIAGNMWAESNINPGIWEGLKSGTWTDLLKGYGLGQWTNTGGNTQGRLYQLHEWLSSNGYSDDSMEGQCKYVIHENYWNTDSSIGSQISYKSMGDFLSSTSTDLDYLTKAWMWCWEGINDGTLEVRQQHASVLLDYLNSHANDTNVEPYVASNAYLSEDQIKINSIWLYRYLGGIGGGGGNTTIKRKHLPIWMMVRRRR